MFPGADVPVSRVLGVVLFQSHSDPRGSPGWNWAQGPGKEADLSHGFVRGFEPFWTHLHESLTAGRRSEFYEGGRHTYVHHVHVHDEVGR